MRGATTGVHKPFQARFQQRRLQGVVGAHLHALAAANAALQKALLVERPGRPNQARIFGRRESRARAQNRQQRCARRHSRQRATALQVGAVDSGGRGGKEFETDSTFRTLAHAVEAEVAFRFAPLGVGKRIVPSLAVQQAAIAVVALAGELLQAQNRPARNDSQQRAQGAQRPAPEAGDSQVERQKGNENRSQEKRLAKVRLPEAEQGFIQHELGNVADRPQRRDRRMMQRAQHASSA